MPYADPEKKKENDRRRSERNRARRIADPEFLAKEKLARRTYINKKYHTDPEFKSRKNRSRVISRYGLTQKAFNALLAEQGRACAICKTPHIDENGKRLFIDHNHALGLTAVRGLLCGPCNMGLGSFKDSPTILRAAAEYLEKLI